MTNVLEAGAALHEGQALHTRTGFKLDMQRDGNLVIYDPHAKAIWASQSNGKGKGPYRFECQQDNNLVVYDFENKAVWASSTDRKGTSPAKVILLDDGALTLYDAYGVVIWFSKKSEMQEGHHGLNIGHVLNNNLTMKQEMFLKAPVTSFHARLQSDGNFVLYRSENFDSGNSYWATATNGKGSAPYRLVMQSDNNLVIYDAHNKAIWSTGTNGKGHGPARLVLDDSGHLKVLDGDNHELWKH
jgi:hypothetical protein